MGASPLTSRAPRRGRNCYICPAFSGVPNTKRREKITSGYLTSAISGAWMRVELLRTSDIVVGPQRKVWGKNHKWPPHPYLLGGVEEGGLTT